jgi:1-acyl-sn-glycerol-3-phosphate acyltransferase
MIRTVFVCVVIFLYILIVGFPFLIHAWLTKNTDRLYRVGVKGAWLALWLAGVEIEVHGRENIPQGRAAIYMSNHQSNSDPPAVITNIPPVLVMAKHSFFRVPVLGTAMVYRGFIPVDRKNRERNKAAIDQAVESLKAGKSFMVFPEGTRSRDGRLQTFKKGVFVMAIRAGALIVPVSVSGARKIMPKGRFAIHPGRVRMTLHAPIDAGNYTLDELMQATRQAVLKGLDPEERPLESSETPARKEPQGE